MQVSVVRPSAVRRVCCCVPGGQEISIDCCTPALGSSRAAARSAAANVSSVTFTRDVGS